MRMIEANEDFRNGLYEITSQTDCAFKQFSVSIHARRRFTLRVRAVAKSKVGAFQTGRVKVSVVRTLSPNRSAS